MLGRRRVVVVVVDRPAADLRRRADDVRAAGAKQFGRLVVDAARQHLRDAALEEADQQLRPLRLFGGERVEHFDHHVHAARPAVRRQRRRPDRRVGVVAEHPRHPPQRAGQQVERLRPFPTAATIAPFAATAPARATAASGSAASAVGGTGSVETASASASRPPVSSWRSSSLARASSSSVWKATPLGQAVSQARQSRQRSRCDWPAGVRSTLPSCRPSMMRMRPRGESASLAVSKVRRAGRQAEAALHATVAGVEGRLIQLDRRPRIDDLVRRRGGHVVGPGVDVRRRGLGAAGLRRGDRVERVVIQVRLGGRPEQHLILYRQRRQAAVGVERFLQRRQHPPRRRRDA